MEKNNITKASIDAALFKFHQSMYLYEKREAAIFDIAWDELYLLQLLIRNPGLSVSETAKMLKAPDFVASRMITRLSTKGFLERKNSIDDKRVVKVYITENGIEKVEAIKQYNYEVIAAQFSKFPADEIRTHIEYIEKLSEFLGLE